MFWLLLSCAFVSESDFEKKQMILEAWCDDAPLSCTDIGSTEEKQYFGCCSSGSLYYCLAGVLEEQDCLSKNQECGFEESGMNCIEE